MIGRENQLAMISIIKNWLLVEMYRLQIYTFQSCSLSLLSSLLDFTLAQPQSKTNSNSYNTDRFAPDTLWYVYTKTLFLWMIETSILKGAFYFLGLGSGNTSPPFFELLSYTGYKFVCLCLIVIAQLLFGTLISYGVLFLTGGLFAFFFFQTIRYHCQTGNTLAEHIKEVSMNRKTLTFMFAGGQVFMIWLLSINWIHWI